MSHETENMLRRSLDAADQHRRRLVWVLCLASVAVVLEFFRLGQIRASGDVPAMIVQAVMALFFTALALAILIIFQVTTATKRILRAIELGSRAQ
jgi:hypothetical protein